MLSPDFENMFDFNYKDKQLRLIKTTTQTVIHEFDQDLITIDDTENEIDGIRKIFAKIEYNDDSRIKIINDQTQRIVRFSLKKRFNEEKQIEEDYVEFVHCYNMSKSEFTEPWNGKSHLIYPKEPLRRN